MKGSLGEVKLKFGFDGEEKVLPRSRILNSGQVTGVCLRVTGRGQHMPKILAAIVMVLSYPGTSVVLRVSRKAGSASPGSC